MWSGNVRVCGGRTRPTRRRSSGVANPTAASPRSTAHANAARRARATHIKRSPGCADTSAARVPPPSACVGGESKKKPAPWVADRPRPRATARLSCCSKDGRRDAPPAGKDQEPPRQGARSATRCGQAPASAIHTTRGGRSKAQVSELRRRRRTRGQAVRKGAELRRARYVHVGIRFARARTSGCEPASGRW